MISILQRQRPTLFKWFLGGRGSTGNSRRRFHQEGKSKQLPDGIFQEGKSEATQKAESIQRTDWRRIIEETSARFAGSRFGHSYCKISCLICFIIETFVVNFFWKIYCCLNLKKMLGVPQVKNTLITVKTNFFETYFQGNFIWIAHPAPFEICGFYFVLYSPLLTFVNSILLFQLVFDTLQKITRTACVCFKTAELLGTKNS